LRHSKFIYPRLAISFASILVATLLSYGASAFAGPIEKLPGRWTGYGQITLLNGASERVKCIATYFLKKGMRANRKNINHNLRCASTSYRIDATANLTVKTRSIAGEWRERTYSTGGAASGRITPSGLRLSIKGDGFQALFAVRTTSRCRQSIEISPLQGLDIKKLTIALIRGC